MARLIVQEFVSVDGLAAGRNDSVDFIPAGTEGNAELEEHQMRFLDSVGTIVLGRATYEMFAAYWPDVEGDDKPFGEKLNAIPKVVFSRALAEAPWGSWEPATISTDDPRDEIPRLRDAADRDLVVWGSLRLVQSLAEAGLVDEYQLWVLPVVLGDGRRLFGDGVGSTTLRLLEARSTTKGATLLRYEAATGR
jgi:dihydrofolate reductase